MVLYGGLYGSAYQCLEQKQGGVQPPVGSFLPGCDHCAITLLAQAYIGRRESVLVWRSQHANNQLAVLEGTKYGKGDAAPETARLSSETHYPGPQISLFERHEHRQ